MPLTLTLSPIADGYTRTAKTEPTEYKYPIVEFTYRPALGAAVVEYRHGCSAGAKSEEKAVVALLLAHIKGWDVRTEKDEVAPVTAELLAIVPPVIRQQLVEIVCGYTAQQQADATKN